MNKSSKLSVDASYRVYYYKWDGKSDERIVVDNAITLPGQPYFYYKPNDRNVILDNKMEYRDGKATSIHWYVNCQHHRENGPAIIYSTGLGVGRKWMKNGILHRSNGPAHTISAAGAIVETHWVYGGIEITENAHDEITAMNFSPNYDEWTTEQKVWLKMKYGGK